MDVRFINKRHLYTPMFVMYSTITKNRLEAYSKRFVIVYMLQFKYGFMRGK